MDPMTLGALAGAAQSVGEAQKSLFDGFFGFLGNRQRRKETENKLEELRRQQQAAFDHDRQRHILELEGELDRLRSIGSFWKNALKIENIVFIIATLLAIFTLIYILRTQRKK